MRPTNILQGFHTGTDSIPYYPYTCFLALGNTVEKPAGFKHEFTSALRQSLIAYAFNIFGIAAGTIVAYFLGIFQSFPWAFIIYPSILSARGGIGGLVCGRLSTGLKLGTVQTWFSKNNRSF